MEDKKGEFVLSKRRLCLYGVTVLAGLVIGVIITYLSAL